jgi:hypothetical protein
MEKNKVLEKINQSQSHAHNFLKTASWLVITLGTSYNYQLKNSKDFVANCHKAPADFFEKNLIELKEIYFNLFDVIKKLQSYNPNLKIIFTISPVRHVRDGIIENNRSKARLIEATHSIVGQNENVFYFPAYELVIDILRDYRFYKSDMVHANEVAVNYIFEIFSKTYLDEAAKKLMSEIKPLLNAMKHKPFHKESVAHQRFLKTQLTMAQKITKANPNVDLSREINYFSSNA